MDLLTDCDFNAAFQQVRKGKIPAHIMHGLVEQFAACPDVMAILAATKNEEAAILGAMVMAFVAGCRFTQANLELMAQEEAQ